MDKRNKVSYRLLACRAWLGLTALQTTWALGAEALNLPDLIERVEPSVVRIEARSSGRFSSASQGSGFLTDLGIVTNLHVIASATSATVSFSDGTELPVLGVRVWDSSKDIAILEIKDVARPPLVLKTELPRKGEAAAAFGAPHGFSFTTSEGIVSAIRSGAEIRKELESYDQADDLRWIQTTAPISSGNSGGPLVSSDGEVIGVNTWTLSGGQNLNFALSSIEVAALVANASESPSVPLADLPDQARTDSGFNSVAERIFVALSRIEFDAAVESRIRAVEESAKRLSELYLSAGATESQIRSAEDIYKREVERLKGMRTYRPAVRQFLRDEGAIIGYPGSWYVLQVLGEDSMLIQPSENSDEVFKLTGAPTAGIADGVTQTFQGIWFTVGDTYSYSTALGARTVYEFVALAAEQETLVAKFATSVSAPEIDREVASLKAPVPPTGAELAKLEAARLEAQMERDRIEQEAVRETQEKKADILLRGAKRFIGYKQEVADKRLREIVEEYPETTSGKEAMQLLGLAPLQFREWTSGPHKTQGRLVAVVGDSVTLENPEGRRISVSLSKLDPADREYVRYFGDVLKKSR